jgi:aspartyl-tRNA(Asn)/glutamyl-tRNA(Gln) amidotransferase subunit C
MNIDRNLIEKVATVARLKLTSDEVNRLIPELKEILDSFEKISLVDTANVEPSFHPIKVRNKIRDDVVKQGISNSDALKNSKFNQDGYFRGPKAI